MASIYSGCQKNVPIFKRFFLQPLMPQFRNSENYYEKRYKSRAAYFRAVELFNNTVSMVSGVSVQVSTK